MAWTRSPARRAALLPWLTLAAFSIASAGLTAVGRLGAGPHTALLSRYATFATPLWLAVGPIMAIALATWPAGTGRTAAIVATGVLASIAASSAWRSASLGEQMMAQRAAITRQAAACMVDPADAPDACYRTVCWNAAWARGAARALHARHLGPWRPGGALDPATR
jgi:hypothetical protein